MLDYERIFQVFHIPPTGVLHVGAYLGEEVTKYHAMGFAVIFFVEADTGLFPHLCKNIMHYPGVRAANVAIADSEKKVLFRRANNLQSSSLLPLKEHAVAYPQIKYAKEMEVQATTIDSLMHKQGLTNKVNFLNIDIQGSELMAFKGAVQSLPTFDAINTEVNLVEMYEGCALIEDIDAFLGGFGFVRVDATFPHRGWGDAFYVKRSFFGA